VCNVENLATVVYADVTHDVIEPGIDYDEPTQADPLAGPRLRDEGPWSQGMAE
jgi:hypothetical protein